MLKEQKCDMVMIQRYIDAMCDECKGALEYAEYYIVFKNSHPQWAKMYHTMAEDELRHLEYLRQITQDYIDNLSWISDHDRECWSAAIQMQAETEMKSKNMLSK